MRPPESEYPPAYGGYISLVPEEEVLPVLEAQSEEIRRHARAAASADRERHRYAEGKWSVREVLGHLTDGERVFGYRAFCIARGETQSLPGFDENEYIANAPYDAMPASDLAETFAALRQANLAVLKRLEPSHWALVGTANNKPVSVRALTWVLAGHPRHHLGILRERYGIKP